MDAGALSALQQRKKRLAGMGRGRKTFAAGAARRRQKKGFAGFFLPSCRETGKFTEINSLHNDRLIL